MSKLSDVARQKTFGDVGSDVAAAGTTQGTATAATGDHIRITTCTEGSAEGIILKTGNAESFRTVVNATSAAAKIYPPVGSAFNGKAANLPLLLPPYMAAFFFFISTTNITVIAGIT